MKLGTPFYLIVINKLKCLFKFNYKYILNLDL